jgi:hypothetical protein
MVGLFNMATAELPTYRVAAFPAKLTILLFQSIVVIAAPLNVMLNTVTFSPIVIVPAPQLALKIATSAAPGTVAPPTPPEVRDQFKTLKVFHVPVPPTQYLLAIKRHLKKIASNKATANNYVAVD